MDGKSLVPLLIPSMAEDGAVAAVLSSSAKAHLESLGDPAQYAASWRDAVFIEYYYVNDNVKCTGNCSADMNHYPNADESCGILTPGNNSECWSNPMTSPGCSANCYATESLANNFIALRTMPWSSHGDTLYVTRRLAPYSLRVFFGQRENTDGMHQLPPQKKKPKQTKKQTKKNSSSL